MTHIAPVLLAAAQRQASSAGAPLLPAASHAAMATQWLVAGWYCILEKLEVHDCSPYATDIYLLLLLFLGHRHALQHN